LLVYRSAWPVLAGLKAELARAPFLADVSIDASWLNEQSALSRALLERLLRHHGFGKAGVLAAATGAPECLVYMRPET
jgi:hypothetical protein